MAACPSPVPFPNTSQKEIGTDKPTLVLETQAALGTLTRAPEAFVRAWELLPCLPTAGSLHKASLSVPSASFQRAQFSVRPPMRKDLNTSGSKTNGSIWAAGPEVLCWVSFVHREVEASLAKATSHHLLWIWRSCCLLLVRSKPHKTCPLTLMVCIALHPCSVFCENIKLLFQG